jgi:hypothetical protein
VFDAAADVLFLREALARARAYSPMQRRVVWMATKAADARARAAASLGSKRFDALRAALLRDALRLRVDAAGVDWVVLVRAALDEDAYALVGAALAASDPLHFDSMDAEVLASVTAALGKAERAARRGVEPRSIDYLRAARNGRVAAIAVAAAYVAYLAITSLTDPPNVAFHKTVGARGMMASLAVPATLVDGDKDATYSPVVIRGVNASFTIDLSGAYALDRVRVFNRHDGGFDNCLPLNLETSIDGETWSLRERRRDHFSVWTERMDQVAARYVRLRTEGLELGLVEVEIYGRYGK